MMMFNWGCPKGQLNSDMSMQQGVSRVPILAIWVQVPSHQVSIPANLAHRHWYVYQDICVWKMQNMFTAD